MSRSDVTDSQERLRRALRAEVADRADDIVPAERLSRRSFSKLMGASAALAGVSGCTKAPPEHIVPYRERPPEVTPGVSRYYATSITRGPYGIGLLAESREGRPIKLEGHPAHPFSLGAAGVREQASLLELYDPERLKRIRGTPLASWRSLVERFGPGGSRPYTDAKGEGLHVLLEPTSSGFVIEQLDRLRERYPKAHVHFDASHALMRRLRGSEEALGQVLETHYDFRKAEVVVALDADFLESQVASLRHARHFARRRKAARPSDSIVRLYAAEATLTVTGARADHRLPLAASRIAKLAAALLARVKNDGRTGDDETWSEPEQQWLRAVSKALRASAGRCAVIVGDHQPPEAHVLVHALNFALNNVGSTVFYTPSPVHQAGELGGGLPALAEALSGQAVDTLVVLKTNPLYSAPGDLQFAKRFGKAKERVVLALHEDETAKQATWALPALHYLESWDDVRALDGTLSFVQPLVRPLYGGYSTAQMLAALHGEEATDAELFKRRWSGQAEGSMRQALARGLLPGSMYEMARPRLRHDAVHAARQAISNQPTNGGAYELIFQQETPGDDGRHANNAWLQELPHPITKQVWGNAARMAPDDMEASALRTGDVAKLRHDGRSVEVPVLEQPGQAPGTITLSLGYGRRSGGRVGQDVGVDGAPLRSGVSPYVVTGVHIERAGRRQKIVRSQMESGMHGRPVVVHTTMDQWREEPKLLKHRQDPPESIQPQRLHGSPQWGMVIDLAACTGCSACVIACQAENNIPVVGKTQMALGRGMHWLRIDRYYAGGGGNGWAAQASRVFHQPMACQHCEKAPCEYVCPTNATVHSPDGLNEMVYNRCIGTRFCSNNCPYKVRKFNFFDWNRHRDGVEKMYMNPDVTVRARGVMEKCTYCVQRIRRADIDAELERRPLRDGDVRTACQQTCPAEAIAFGNIEDPDSEVSQQRQSKRSYGVLHDLGTQPRTRYLADLRDIDPELKG